MNDPALPPNLGAKLKDLEERIHTLETANRMLATSIKGGQFVVYDSSGNVVTIMGDVTPYGTGLYAAGGSVPAMLVSGSGWVAPYFAHPWQKGDDNYVTTSGTFVTTWICRAELVTCTVIRFTVVVICDAATTGEIRVTQNGTQLGNTYSLSAGQTNLDFGAVHSSTLTSGPIYWRIQARRTGGAGNVYIYSPTELVYGGSSSEGGGLPTPAGGWQTF